MKEVEFYQRVPTTTPLLEMKSTELEEKPGGLLTSQNNIHSEETNGETKRIIREKAHTVGSKEEETRP